MQFCLLEELCTGFAPHLFVEWRFHQLDQKLGNGEWALFFLKEVD